jgi:hypothetical protein
MSIWLALTTCITSVPILYVTLLLRISSSTEWWQSWEYEHDLSPAWRFVVKHFRWTNRLQTIANGYLRRIFEIPADNPIPPVRTSYWFAG